MMLVEMIWLFKEEQALLHRYNSLVSLYIIDLASIYSLAYLE